MDLASLCLLAVLATGAGESLRGLEERVASLERWQREQGSASPIPAETINCGRLRRGDGGPGADAGAAGGDGGGLG